MGGRRGHEKGMPSSREHAIKVLKARGEIIDTTTSDEIELLVASFLMQVASRSKPSADKQQPPKTE